MSGSTSKRGWLWNATVFVVVFVALAASLVVLKNHVEANSLENLSAPAEPTMVSAVATSSGAKVSWAASADNGSAITTYTVLVAEPDSFVSLQQVTVRAPMTAATIETLATDTAYVFRVRATNAIGPSRWSRASEVVRL